jgi:PASTA domain./Protein kinase domain.
MCKPGVKSMDNFTGKKLDGRYEIQEIIGVGGMAVVYKAYDSIDDRIVAIKVLKEEYLQNDEFRRRFKNESKAIAVLSHPNIVKVYDVSFGDRIQYIVMEYIDGITLKEYIEQQKVLTWKEAVHFTVQILRALAHAHERGIVHRDIKPQNIMMLEDGTIKVTDFGIARFAQSETKTMTDKAIGSVHYISPEQARGSVTDAKADIYSVGVMLYEMLTGRLPFEADSAVSVAIMQMQQEPKPPRLINPEIPEGLEEITLHAMQKDPDQRYRSAAEMLEDIERFKRNPDIRFQYKYFIDESPTKYVDAISEIRSGRSDLYERNYERGKGAKKGKKKPNTLPILAGITAALVIVVVGVTIAAMAIRGFFGGGSLVVVPNLVGQNYDEVKLSTKYSDFEIVQKNTEYSEAPAGQIIKQDPEAGTKVKKHSTINVTVSKGPQGITVPDVTGKDKNLAKSTLESEGFTNVIESSEYSEDVPKGQVIRTDPEAGQTASKDDPIVIYVSMGPETKMSIVPPVVGMTRDQAIRAIQDAGLTADFQGEEPSDSVPVGKVTRQEPGANSQVQSKSTVKFWISKGKETKTIEVPNVANMPLAEAQNMLLSKGFQINSEIQYVDSKIQEGLVIKTDPPAFSQAYPGTVITLYVSKGDQKEGKP